MIILRVRDRTPGRTAICPQSLRIPSPEGCRGTASEAYEPQAGGSVTNQIDKP